MYIVITGFMKFKSQQSLSGSRVLFLTIYIVKTIHFLLR